VGVAWTPATWEVGLAAGLPPGEATAVAAAGDAVALTAGVVDGFGVAWEAGVAVGCGVAVPVAGVGLLRALILSDAAAELEATPVPFGWTPKATATIRTTTAPGIKICGFRI